MKNVLLCSLLILSFASCKTSYIKLTKKKFQDVVVFYTQDSIQLAFDKTAFIEYIAQDKISDSIINSLTLRKDTIDLLNLQDVGWITMIRFVDEHLAQGKVMLKPVSNKFIKRKITKVNGIQTTTTYYRGRIEIFFRRNAFVDF